MWVWLQTNADVISALAAVATLGIWALYLQLIYGSLRRSRRSKILINRGAGQSVDARCIVSNMGAEPIYLEAVRLTLGWRGQEATCSLSDLDVTLSQDTDPRPQWMQGPVASSEMIDLGTFRSLADRAFDASLRQLEGATDHDARKAELTVLIVASVTSEERVVAARRSFRVAYDGQRLKVHPRSLRTSQIRSGQERAQVEELLNRDLNEEWRRGSC